MYFIYRISAKYKQYQLSSITHSNNQKETSEYKKSPLCPIGKLSSSSELPCFRTPSLCGQSILKIKMKLELLYKVQQTYLSSLALMLETNDYSVKINFTPICII
jgi:hypothetical protein